MTPADPYPPLPVRLAAGLAALAGLLVVLAGVPAALWVFIGWPLPDHLPTAAELAQALRELPVTGTGLLKTLAVVCWIAWAQLAAAVLAEAAAQLRAAPTPRLRLVPPASQQLAARLVGAVALLTLASGPRTAIALPLTAPTPAVTASATAPATATPATPAAPDEVTSAAGRPAAPVTPAAAADLKRYTVGPRDDLWTIAETCLGDPYRWREIYDTNRGVPQPDGETLTDPDHIEPGWTLLLPADATLPAPDATEPAPPAAGAPTALPQPEPPATPDHHPAQPDARAAEPTPEAGEADPTLELPAQPQPPPPPAAAADPAPAAPAAPSAGWGTAPEEPPPAVAEPAEREPAGPAVRLPDGGLLALTVAAAVSACLAAARLLARRRRPLGAPAAGLDTDDPLAGPAARAARRVATDADPDTALHPAGGPRPAVLAAGVRGSETVTIDPSAGPVRLAGPAATVDATARGLLVAYLSTAHPLDATATIAAAGLADRLLADTPPFPGLTTSKTLSDALAAVEVELLTRTRLLDLDGHRDRVALLTADTRETMPLLLLVTDHDPGNRQRLDTLLSLGRRVGLTALILGDPHPDTTRIDHDGTVTDPGTRHHLAGATLSTLSAPEATDLLRVVAAARATGTHAPPLNTQQAADRTDPADVPPGTARAADFPVPAAPGDSHPPITVTLLGAPRIDTPAGELRAGLRGKARELLAYLLIHPDGVTVDTARDVLWPDADPDRIDGNWRTTLSNLQTTLRRHAGLDPTARPISRSNDRLRPNPELLDADLWRLQTALAAARSDDPDTANLQQAVDLYRGDLCDGEHYEWVEPAREDLRRRIVDAAARLARHHQHTGNLDAAADALDRAATIDPYNEPLHQQLMRLHAQRGHPEAVTTTYQRLTTRLADLDLDPDSSTERLHRELLGHRPGAAPARREHARRLAPARPVAQRPNRPRAS